MRRCAGVILLAIVSACGATYESASTQVLVDPAAASNAYFGSVWPDDRRLAADGAFEAIDFPNPNGGTLFDTVLETSDRLVSGWGLSSPLFVPFGGAIDKETLPANPAVAMGANATVYLVAVDPDSSAYGQRVPLEWHWFEEPTSFLPGHVLSVRPSVGFPLEERTRYALVVTTQIEDASGAPVGAQPALWDALNLTGEEAPADAGYWQPLADYLDDHEIDRETVAGATLFTTQDATGELLKVRDAALKAPAPTLDSLSYIKAEEGFVLFQGRYTAPNYQHGKPPYEYQGGGFRFDEQGKPIVGVQESLRVSICAPSNKPMPAGGYPVVLYSHGTGGDYESAIDDETCQLMAAQGLAVFTMDQVLHGPRAPKGAQCLTQPVENCFFNLVNGPAGRSTIRQSAIDNIFLRRLAAEVTIDATLDPYKRTLNFDTTHLGFFGHSQGGLTGALYAAIEPELAGAMLSAGGGHLTTSILQRDGGSLKDLAESPLFLNLPEGESLGQFHPAVALIQMLGEAADPLTWSRLWFKKPQGQRKHMFLTGGWLDDATPPASTEAMAASAGVPQLDFGHRTSVAHDLHGLVPLVAPLKANIPASGDWPAVTAGLQQFPTHGHFPIFNDEGARKQLAAFMKDVVAGRVPELPRNQ